MFTIISSMAYGQRKDVEELKRSLDVFTGGVKSFADDAVQLQTYTGVLDLLTRGDVVHNLTQGRTYQKLWERHRPAVVLCLVLACVCGATKPILLSILSVAGLYAYKWHKELNRKKFSLDNIRYKIRSLWSKVMTS